MSKDVIVLIYHSYKDPIFHGLMLQYLKAYNRDNTHHFHLITFEQEAYQLNASEQAAAQAELNQHGITWYPIPYHTGSMLVLKKAYDVWLGYRSAKRIKKQYNVQTILGFTAVSGAISYLFSRWLKLQLVLFNFEPHSDYMVDFGTWSKGSLKYKILHRLERKQAMRSKHLAVPTTHTLQLVNNWHTTANTYMVPTSIDTDLLVFSPEQRAALREQLQLNNKRVALYLGKFDGIYYSASEVGQWVKQLQSHINDLYLWVITPNNVEEVRQALGQHLPASSYQVQGTVPYAEIAHYISASDIGLVAIPPYPSQKYRCPIKTANYLSCGVPYLINKGIADDDAVAEKHQVGVAFDDFSAASIDAGVERLNALLAEDQQTLRQRCREVAIQYRGIHNTVEALQQML